MKNKNSKKNESKPLNNGDVTIVRKGIYTINWIEYADGNCSMERRCEGIAAYELLGMLALTQQEIIDQIKGRIRPNFVKREVVKVLCDVCGSDNVIEAPSMGRNCNSCNPL